MSHSSCPHCHNTKQHSIVYKCKRCGCIFCEVCKGGFLRPTCPKCHKIGLPIGSVGK